MLKSDEDEDSKVRWDSQRQEDLADRYARRHCLDFFNNRIKRAIRNYLPRVP